MTATPRQIRGKCEQDVGREEEVWRMQGTAEIFSTGNKGKGRVVGIAEIERRAKHVD